MKQIIFSCLFFTVLLSSKAQSIQWAFRVLDYSSQKDNKWASAKQAIGAPNVSPAGMSSEHAWEPKESNKQEFIKVGFQTPIIPKKIVIVESFNPGSITQIFAYDAEGKEYSIATYKPKSIKDKSRVFYVNTADLDYYVLALKIVFKPFKDQKIGIDAIGITESDKPADFLTKPSEISDIGVNIKKLGDEVNSVYPELGPLPSPDGKTLYFSRRYDPKNTGGAADVEDIWYSNWDEQQQKWSPAKNMGIPLNTKDPNFINSISPDGNTVLLGNSYKKDGTMDDGVSISRRTAKGWSFPKRLNIEDERNVNDRVNYYMSNSQRILLISGERKGETEGDRDIYVSFYKNDSLWSKPMNLGKVINTRKTEAAPFLASDDKTLYFTSDGLGGYGGSDIYVSRRLDDTWLNWSKPENLGSLINTTYDESYFTLSAEGDMAYFTSKGHSAEDVDMYTVNLPEFVRPLPVVLIKGRVMNSKTKRPEPDVKIIFEDLETGQEVGVAVSNPTNATYEIVLPAGKNYGYLAEKMEFVSVHLNMDLSNLSQYSEIRKDLFIAPIEVGQTITLNNLFFDTDQFSLKKSSYLELNRLAKILKDKKTMKVQVSGYTDNIGSESYNDKLAYKRANAVVNYLSEKSGLDSKRIVAKSYGEASPVADNSTSTGRKLNRRVEFKVLLK
ncbi:MAG: OmpA family protein [Opitutaceae bacterium]|nr:OmpA family protein [Cytophagales bacterium]